MQTAVARGRIPQIPGERVCPPRHSLDRRPTRFQAFGIVVFGFPEGHGASLRGLTATQTITASIPVMIFAFLFGLSMDCEVFMLSRMREAYDETGSTDKAIELGLVRTGKLVTGAALILMFAFLVLSSPGYEAKSLAIGLAAGIIFDSTVILPCSCRP